MSKTLKTQKSGKQGNTVSYKSHYGQAERERAIPANPRTNAQGRSRGALTQFATRWRSLTDEQRAVWITTALRVNSEPRMGQSGALTGCQLYIKINCILAACGQPPTDTPTDRPSFSKNPVTALAITNDADGIALNLSVPRAPAYFTLVLGTAPCSAGMSVPRRFVILGSLPAPVGRVCNVADMYKARYGTPPVGSRVFIRTVQVENGWEDFPRDTTAVVPAK